MEPKPRFADDVEELPYADPPAPEVGFRTPGALVSRAAELEQEVGQLRDQLRVMERDMYASRQLARRHRAASAVMTGGVGGTLGAFVALVLWCAGVLESAGPVLALVLPAWVFGALCGYKWEKGDFPAAPPPRFR